MKILMLLENEYLNDPRVEKEVQTLFMSGNEIIVAAIAFSGLPEEEKRNNCIVFRRHISSFIHKSGVGALKFPFYFNFWRSYTNDIFKRVNIDVVHIHDLPLARIGIELKRKHKIKLVLDLHENWPALLKISVHTNTFMGKILSSEKEWRSYEKKCVHDSDAVIVVAEEMKVRISELGILPEKVFVLGNTPVLKTTAELKFDRDENYFTMVYLGGISYHRGLQYVIEGIKLLVPDFSVRLWIAGDGKYSEVLKEKARQLKLGDFVKFFGNIPKSGTDDLLRMADIGLIPHLRSEQSDNSSPNKLFEYMEAGLPVLASNCTSIKRVIEESAAGITYIFDSPSDFANAVKVLYTDRKKTNTFGVNGKNAVKEKYNWQKSSVALLKLYAGFK